MAPPPFREHQLGIGLASRIKYAELSSRPDFNGVFVSPQDAELDRRGAEIATLLSLKLEIRDTDRGELSRRLDAIENDTREESPDGSTTADRRDNRG